MTTTDHQIPAQVTSGQTVDTTEDGLPATAPAFMQHGAPISDPGEALRNPHAADLNRLNSFLMERFPQQMSRTNRPIQETPVDTAIRLLSGLSSTGVFARCTESYCNLPEAHDGDHGFVQYAPR
jgi:hypothetical protein